MPKKLREILESSDKPFNEFMEKRREKRTTKIPGLEHVNIEHLGGGEYIINVKDKLTPEHARLIHDHMRDAYSYEVNGSEEHLANLLSMPPVGGHKVDVAEKGSNIFYVRKEDKK